MDYFYKIESFLLHKSYVVQKYFLTGNSPVDEIKFYYNGSDANAQVLVYDLLGNEVARESVHNGNNTLNLKSINGNSFILLLTDSKGNYSQKLIKHN